MLALALSTAADAEFTAPRITYFILLVAASAACSRFPIKLGVSNSFLSLDSVPLVLGALLLPVHDAVLLGFTTTIISLHGQPRLPGKQGWYWWVQTIFASSAVLGFTSFMAKTMLPESGLYTPVLFIPALLTALLLELAFDVTVWVEAESEKPGYGRYLFESRVVPVSNVILPAIAATILTPYTKHPIEFAILLPVLLAAMYGAFWVANSEQLERRRGLKLRETFSRYVPEGIVSENIETMEQVELGGEQHRITVLFCDIRGFTSWAESRDATEVVAQLNVLLTELSASVMQHGGTLDKFTGDGLMAFWGAPLQIDDHAEKACRAALDMLHRLEVVNEQRVAQNEPPHAIGIGIHTGDAVVGNVGHERRLDYTAIGDTVNTAARLEAATSGSGVSLMMSKDSTLELNAELGDQARKFGEVEVKGKEHPIEVWTLDIAGRS